MNVLCIHVQIEGHNRLDLISKRITSWLSIFDPIFCWTTQKIDITFERTKDSQEEWIHAKYRDNLRHNSGCWVLCVFNLNSCSFLSNVICGNVHNKRVQIVVIFRAIIYLHLRLTSYMWIFFMLNQRTCRIVEFARCSKCV